ncbi:hypothetical protein ES705_08233 [subsurface metagenome]
MFSNKSFKFVMLIILLTSFTIFSGCGGGNPATPPIDNDDSDSEEIELIEVVSKEINIYEGGVIEVTDESSEIFGTRVIVEPIDTGEKLKTNPVTFTIFIKNVFEGDWTIGDYQGFLVSPVVVKAYMDLYAGLVPPDIPITLELPYNEHKLSNAGVSKNDTPNLYWLNDNNHFEKVPVNEYSCENDKITIELNRGEEGYYSCHALTVTNCDPPGNLGQPLPGDLVYRLSSPGGNNNWLPGHVGIYVGERYGDHDKDPSTPDQAYNVIEAVGNFISFQPLDIGGKVEANNYESLTYFNLDGQASYMGARQLSPSLTHTVRNEIVKFAEDQIGKEYAFIVTFGFLAGLANGDRVKGPKFNCVGLAEAAYESVGLDIVSDYDEGNQFDSPGPDLPNPDAILSPQEQLNRTVPATGLPVLNVPPEISNIEVIPEGSVNTNSLVIITCNASDADQDDLTYVWTVPEWGTSITSTKGKTISWGTPNEEGNYAISCKVIDNYGGEDKKSINISVGESINHPPAISELTANPHSVDVNQTTIITCTASDEDVGDTLVYTWTKTGGTFEGSTTMATVTWRAPSTPGNYTVTCEVSDGNESDSKSVNIEVTAIVCNSFIPRYLLDLIDTYANSYYNSAWRLTLDQYKAWIATIAWSEGKKGGFTAHSQYSTDSYPHIYLHDSFKFARGIGPFQLDQHGWDWPTIEKLNPEKALLDVLKTHKNNYGSGSFLQNFSNNSDWRKGVWPGKVETEWFEVTGSAWKDNNNGKNPDLNWSEIKSSLEDSSYENSYECNVKDIGNRKWNITSNDNLFTSTAKPVIFNGNYPTWLINAKKWDGSPLFSYYYTYDQNEGIEVWVYDDYDGGTTYKYIFVREYSTGPYPEGYLNYYCGYTLSHSALTPTPAASLTPEEIELMGKWGFGGDYIVRRWPDGDVNVYDETNYTRIQDVIQEWNTAIGGPIVFRLSSDPNSPVKVKFDPDLSQDLAGQYFVYCSDDNYEFYRADVNIQKNYLDSLNSDTKYCLHLWLFSGAAGFNIQADVDPNPYREWWNFSMIPDDIKTMLRGLYKVPCGYNLLNKKLKENWSRPIVKNLKNIYEGGLYKLYKEE